MFRAPVFVMCVAAVGACLVSTPARADEPTRLTEVRPLDYPPSGARSLTLVAGGATTLGWYGAAVGMSYLWDQSPGASELRIPVAGPWMSLARTGCPKSNPNCETYELVIQAAFTAISGVGQAGGLAVLVEGLFLPTRSAQQPVAPRSAARPARAPRLMAAPLATPHGVGLGMWGEF